MTEILFYQLKGQTLDQVLPPLIQRSLDRGWRVVVQAASDERVEALDAHLWTWRDDAFVPHGTWRDAEAAEQPVLLTVNDGNPNGAAIRFLVEGAEIPADVSVYERLVLVFDGDDPEALETARERWGKAKREGFSVTYWRTDENGRWERQA
jgi:DNA polymerase III subunit chi